MRSSWSSRGSWSTRRARSWRARTCRAPGPWSCRGGEERSESVSAGLAALSDRVERVLVHDAARCLTPVAVFERVLAAPAAGVAGAVPGVAVVDTVKVVDAGGLIVDTPLRESLRAVQTPQGFVRSVLTAAHAAGAAATDDAALVEALGHDVLVVEGDHRALKVTTPDDWPGPSDS
nr:2-C-methyl-D-erythritol 4-phosphate cytidylyltransferase [Janibacter limosus]